MISQLDIFPKYEHSKFGKFMFDLCAAGAKFLNKNISLYYILSFTWGLIMSLIGVILIFILLSLGNFIISIINLIITYINNYNFIKLNNKKELLLKEFFKIKKFHNIWYMEVGKNWGGVNLGICFFCSKDSGETTKNHEYGHSFQNCILGPLFLFLVAIPSFIRYWRREFIYKKDPNEYYNLPDYDAVWFEDFATRCGNYITNL